MKLAELKKKNEKQLKEELLAQRKKQLSLRFEKTNNTLKSTADLRKARRLIATIKTLLTEQRVNAG